MIITAARRSGFILPLIFSLSLFVKPAGLYAQANSEVYGQNRVQYRTFDWKFFDTRHFRVYHYDRNGIALARYVAEQAERDLPNIERRMGGTFPKRFNIILYNNYEESRQTNVGLKYESQNADVPAGMVNLQGDRLVVYFNGVHTDLRRQIRLGMARVVLERMLLGDNFREMVKNTFMQNTPPWVTDGYISYLVDGWDQQSESEWKNALDANPHANYYELSDRYPELGGKAFYKYTGDRYGESTIRSLLFAIQGRSSLNQGIKLTYGKPVKEVYDSLLAYYHEAYTKDALVQETPPIDSALISIRLPKSGAIKSFRISPRGHDIAYCEFKQGEYRVYIQHTDKQQTRSQIIYEGQKDYNETVPDPDYPIMAWSNNGYKLALLFKRNRQTRLRIYDSRRAKILNYVIPPNRFDRVLGMALNEDNDRIIFSAIKKSQTDLYEFSIRGSKMTNITNDVWDDVQPQFVSGGSRRGILFMSNRPRPDMIVPAEVNELPTGPMNIYFYDTKTQSNTLLQLSYNRSGGNITQPIQYGPDNFAYLLDTNGIQNKYVVSFVRKAGNLDSAVSVPVTNYSRSILAHQYNADGRDAGDVLQIGDAYKVFYGPLVIPGESGEVKTLQPTTLSQAGRSLYTAAPFSSSFISRENGDAVQAPVVKSGNTFKTEFLDTTANLTTVAGSGRSRTSVLIDTELLLNPIIKDSTYLKLKSQPYRLSFKPDFFTLKLDNTVLFNKYQSVATNGGSFTNPPLSGLITVSLNDALENHRFTGGIRVAASLSGPGLTYFLQYQNFKRRVDWDVLYLRTANYYVQEVGYLLNGVYYSPEVLQKSVVNLLQGSASYPLDRVRRIGMHFGLRQDVLDYKAEDTLSLSLSPRTKQYWGLSRLEYVFDNSRILTTNIREGFRYKAYGEYLLGLSEANKGGFYNFGLDFRYYHRIYKNTIFAIRLAGAHSAGNQHILYYLGGVDNWLLPKQAISMPTAGGQNYAFQSLATNLRGYEQNARNGNTYAVANLELRFPVLTTLIRKPIQSSFLRNLQLVGFTDGGSAWNGLLPNVGDSKKQVTLIQPNNPVILLLDLPNADGFALGYGAGLRSTVLSYFMRLDAAWNIDGRRKPIWYFSIGTDF